MPLEAGALLLDVAGWGAPLWGLCGAAIDGLLRLAHAVASARARWRCCRDAAAGHSARWSSAGCGCACGPTRVRLLGAVPFAAGALGAALAPAPDLLVTGDGRHLAWSTRRHAAPAARPRRRLSSAQPDRRSLGLRRRSRRPWHAPFSACSRDACVAEIAQGRRRVAGAGDALGDRIDWAESHPRLRAMPTLSSPTAGCRAAALRAGSSSIALRSRGPAASPSISATAAHRNRRRSDRRSSLGAIAP